MKHLASIGIAFLMIASGLIIITSNSAVAIPDTHTWDGGGGDELASTGANWDSDAAPDTGDTLVFDAGSKNCTMNIAKTFGNITVKSSYSGTITQTAAIGCSDFWGSSGSWNGGGFIFTDSGNFNKTSGISIISVSLVMTGTNKFLNAPTSLDATSLRISGNTIFNTGTFYTNNLTVDSGKTLWIKRGLDFNFRCGFATTYLSNLGYIKGQGNFKTYWTATTTQDTTLTFGSVMNPVSVFCTASVTRNSVLTLGANTILGGALNLYSLHGTYTITLSTSTYDLNVTSAVMIGDRATLTHGSGLLEVGNLTLYSASATYTQGGNLYVRSGQINTKAGTFTQDETHYIKIHGNITNNFGLTHELTDENSLYSLELMRTHPEQTKFAITHQGDCNVNRPPETMAAFQYAFDMGAREFEFDARQTLDGYWVVQHDTTWNSATNGTGNVADTNWIGYGENLVTDIFTVQGTDYYSWTQEPVLQVSTLLTWAKDKNIVLWLDNKVCTESADTSLHTLLNNSGAKDRIIVETATIASCNRFSEMLRCYSLFGWVTTHAQYEGELQNASTAGVEYVTVYPESVINPDGFADAHSLGIGVFACWNFDFGPPNIPPASEMIAILDAGANAVVSNDANIAVQIERNYEDTSYIYYDYAEVTVIPTETTVMIDPIETNGNITITISGDPATLTVNRTDGNITVLITDWDFTNIILLSIVANWTITQTNQTNEMTYEITGLNTDYGFKVFKNGSVIYQQDYGGSATFTSNGSGYFEVKVWYPHTISVLISIIFIMLAIGIVVGVTGETVNSFRKKAIPDDEMTKRLLNMVLYIIIGLALLGAVYATFS